MTTYGAYEHDLPCKNTSCKSHGTPHPNCQCYGGFAKGGQVGRFCDKDQAHQKGCQYFVDGGEVDDDASEAPAPEPTGSSDDQDDSEPSPAVAPTSKTEPTDNDDSNDSDAPNLSPTDKGQAIRDYLSQKYAQAADTSDVEDAREQEQQDIKKANLGHGLSEMFMAGSAAHGGPGASEQDYKTKLAQAHMPVAQAEQDRQNAIKDFLTGQQIGRQSDQDIQKSKEWQAANDLNDPTSKKSQVAVHLFQKQFPDALKGWSPEEIGSLTANDITKLGMPGQEAAAKLQMARTMAGQRLDYQQQARQDKIDAKELAVANGDVKGLRGFLDNQTQSARGGIGVANAKVNSADRVMGSVDINTSDPVQLEEIRRSKTDPKVAAALAAKMDQKTPQQYMEIVNGLLSTIAPGSGGLGQLEHLRADTAGQQMSKIKTYFDSNPHPAGMGATIVNNLQTLMNERDISENVIKSHADKARQSFPNAFSHPETKGQAEAMLGAYTNQQGPQASKPADAVASSAASSGGPPGYVKVKGGWQKAKPQGEVASSGN